MRNYSNIVRVTLHPMFPEKKYPKYIEVMHKNFYSETHDIIRYIPEYDNNSACVCEGSVKVTFNPMWEESECPECLEVMHDYVGFVPEKIIYYVPESTY